MADLLSQGPQPLQENRHAKLLEEIHQLSGEERQNISIKILKGFAYLKKWLHEKDKNAKHLWNNLYEYLEKSRDRSTTPILLRIAKDPDEWTRLYAVSLLGNMGDQRALNELQQIANTDPNRRIRRSASKTIESIQKRR